MVLGIGLIFASYNNMGNYLFIFIFLFASFVHGEPLKGKDSTYFYKVSKNGQTSYVLGSYHYGVSLDELNPQIKDLHSSSQLHFYEIQHTQETLWDYFDGKDDPMALVPYLISPAKRKDRLTPAAVEKVVKLGVPRSVAKLLGNQHCNVVLTHDILFSGKSIDFELMNQSYSLNRPVLELDSPGLRKETYNMDEKKTGVSSDSSVSCNVTKDLLGSRKAYLEARKIMKDLMKSYKRGDSKNDSFKNTRKSALVYHRNKKWAEAVAEKLSRYNSFITVGGSHLHGPNGFLKHLKEKGFKVEPMPWGTSDYEAAEPPVTLSSE